MLQSCKFYPVCSSYGQDALHEYGIFKGSWLIILRLLRCHPFAKPGYDPVK